jgi:hypothetical protein
MKNLDDMKADFKGFKFARMNVMQKDKSGTEEENAGLRWVIDAVKLQDRADERYILNKKILPVALGIIVLTLLLAFLHIPNLLILAGFILVYAGLVSILILFLRDYRNISSETFDQALLDYLEAKRERLVKWKRIPVLYNVIYGFYIIGVLLIIIGNTPLAEFLAFPHAGLLYTLGIISALIISGVSGEYRFRKRHQSMHQPILERIDSLLTELRANGDTNQV